MGRKTHNSREEKKVSYVYVWFGSKNVRCISSGHGERKRRGWEDTHETYGIEKLQSLPWGQESPHMYSR